MDLILASSSGAEERIITDNLDMDLGGTNDFQIAVSYGTWTGDLTEKKKIYVPGTEYGGIIKTVKSATNTDQISVLGYTWRGYLDKRIIIPPAGQDYYIASGDLNGIISALVNIPGFVVDGSAGRTVSNYKFGRYVTVLSGINAMLSSVGYRLDIKYKQTQAGGYVALSAVPVTTYNDEFSQDSNINFFAEDNRQGVNHLICLGKGELRDRIVIHLYADKNGNISTTQTIFGIDEIVETFESPSAEAADLTDQGTKRLKELLNHKSFTAELNSYQFPEMNIGDVVSGRDYITGTAVKEPITQKIIKIENGLFSAEYKIGGTK